MAEETESKSPDPAATEAAPSAVEPNASAEPIAQSTPQPITEPSSDVETKKLTRTQKIMAGWSQIIGARKSVNPEARSKARWFIVSLVGIPGVVLWFAWVQVQHRQELKKLADQAREIEEAKKIENPEIKFEKKAQQSLGIFQFEARLAPGERIQPRAMNLVQIEVQVECDTDAACKWLDKNLPVARDRVTGSFSTVTRSEMLKPTGKQYVRDLIKNRLNTVVSGGQVTQVYFTKLIIN